MEADIASRTKSGRRARIVCQRCHSKKIRCDLQGRSPITCSACVDAAVPCEIRPSHRGHHRKKAKHHSLPTAGVTTHTAALIGMIDAQEPSRQVPLVTASGGRYIRSLLGHQSALHNVITGTSSTPGVREAIDTLESGVLQSYREIFFDLCYTWMPIIDPGELEVSPRSLLLDHSIAAIANTIRPSLLPGCGNACEHYERARHLFHSRPQENALVLIKVALLLSCFDHARKGSAMDSSFWWLGVAIRLAQDLRIHREPRTSYLTQDIAQKKRIWWTLYARERIAALCQGRPCMINEDECSLATPELVDFSDVYREQGQVWMQWIFLARIMGQVSKYMLVARRSGTKIPTQAIAVSLTTWLNGLPASLQLCIHNPTTSQLALNTHLLYLPYLTTIALMYLNTTGQDLPEISVAAVLAAACTARILKDILLRGSIDGLPEDTGWFITIAITALMHVRPLTSLASLAADDINVLRTALAHLAMKWTSAKVLAAGLDRILDRHQAKKATGNSATDRVGSTSETAVDPSVPFTPGAQSLQDLQADDGVCWTDLFPFTTTDTSPLVSEILMVYQQSLPELWPPFDFGEGLDDLWRELDASQTELFGDIM